MIGQPQLQPQRGKKRVLAGRGQRVAQPLPRVTVLHRCFRSLDDGQRPLPVGPACQRLPPQYEVGPCRQNAQQVPQLAYLGLDRRGRAEQYVPGAGADTQHEVEQVVGLVPLLAQPAASACLVRFIQDHCAELARQQVPALFGVMEDQSGGHNGNLRRAPRHVFGPARPDFVSVLVQPHLLGGRPHRARYAEFVDQFHLPLHRQRRRAQDQHRPIVQQCRHHGTGGQRQCLADTHLVGQQQPGATVSLTVLQKHRHERALPGLQLFATPVDRAFGQRRGRHVFRPGIGKTNLHAVRDAFDLFDDGVGQRVGVGPQRRKLFFDPGHALGRVVFPQDLVVLGERAAGLVDRAQEAGLRAIGAFYHAGLAMHKNTVLRHHPNLDPATGEQCIQLAVAVAVQQRFHLRRRLVPALLQGSLTGVPGDQYVSRIELAVADYLHCGNRRDLFTHQLKDRTSKVTRYTPIRLGARQLLAEKRLVQPLPT